jgi:hypothetical protein
MIDKLLSLYKKHDGKLFKTFNILKSNNLFKHNKKWIIHGFDYVTKRTKDRQYFSVQTDGPATEENTLCQIYFHNIHRLLYTNNVLTTIEQVISAKETDLRENNINTISLPYRPTDLGLNILNEYSLLNKLLAFKPLYLDIPEKFTSMFMVELMMTQFESTDTDVTDADYVRNLIVFKSKGKLTGTIKELEDRSYLIIPPDYSELSDEYLLTNEVEYYYYLAGDMTSQYHSN